MGGSVGFGDVTPHTERWVSKIPFKIPFNHNLRYELIT